MPTISMFYGVLIRMFFYDTDKPSIPHIHAEFQGQVDVYSIPLFRYSAIPLFRYSAIPLFRYSAIPLFRYSAIPQGELLAGSLPPKKHKMVIAWIAIHEDELMADWGLAVNGKKRFAIRALDQ